jgi:hypothetical protein
MGTTRDAEYQDAWRKAQEEGPLPGALPPGLVLPNGLTVEEFQQKQNEGKTQEEIDRNKLPDWYVEALRRHGSY